MCQSPEGWAHGRAGNLENLRWGRRDEGKLEPELARQQRESSSGAEDREEPWSVISVTVNPPGCRQVRGDMLRRPLLEWWAQDWTQLLTEQRS